MALRVLVKLHPGRDRKSYLSVKNSDYQFLMILKLLYETGHGSYFYFLWTKETDFFIFK